MENNLIAEKRKLDEETRAKYEALEVALLTELQRLQAVLAALGRPPMLEPKLKPADEPSPILDGIRGYLRTRGGPAPVPDIIRAVGGARAAAYPNLWRPYGDIWKSLQYHDKHNGEVVAVTWEGDHLKRGKLLARPHKPRNMGGRIDRAEDYAEPQTLFWFRDEIKTFKKQRVQNPSAKLEC